MLRKSSQLLVSLISPQKAISSQSVSRWWTRALRMAGIELGYSGHSTRGASRLLISSSKLQTFERFYHREASRAAFVSAVLSSVNGSHDQSIVLFTFQLTCYALFVLQVGCITVVLCMTAFTWAMLYSY